MQSPRYNVSYNTQDQIKLLAIAADKIKYFRGFSKIASKSEAKPK